MSKYIICVFLLIFSCVANAQWITRSEENIFNEKKSFMMGTLSNSSGVIGFDCDNGELSISYIEEDKKTESVKAPMNLMIKIDSNDIVKFDAIMDRRNDNSMEIASNDRIGIISLLSQLKNAKSKFLIGIVLPGTDAKSSYYGDVAGSTKAVDKLVSDCGIDLNAK
ncbi:hypothetical protein [Photorhabdus sp. RM323S]|uniref:hypothetical protein n=1 Tax=Photorhabdus sp. RM323S TaxID=3342828 RepID=UPI0036D898BF